MPKVKRFKYVTGVTGYVTGVTGYVTGYVTGLKPWLARHVTGVTGYRRAYVREELQTYINRFSIRVPPLSHMSHLSHI